MSAGRVVVEADGGSRGNPGPAGYGAVVLDPDSGEVLAERNEFIGTATNNVAEYGGLIAGLQAAHELGAAEVAVRMDSKLVVEQMKGTWQVKNAALRDLARQASELRAGFERITFTWIPREQNKHADRLANEAMDRGTGRPPKATRKTASTAAKATGAADTTPIWVPPTTTPARLVIVRHGATEHSKQMRFSGRNDLALDDVGRTQAAALAARDWVGEFGEVAAVVSSPLHRAVQTAEAIATGVGRTVDTIDGFAEADFGEWEGRTMSDVRERDAAALSAWFASTEVAPPGGESFADVGRRVRRARDAVLAAHPHGTVVLVSHVTPIKSLLRLALDAPATALFRIHLDTASVSVVDYFDDGNCSVRLVNDTSHLRR